MLKKREMVVGWAEYRTTSICTSQYELIGNRIRQISTDLHVTAFGRLIVSGAMDISVFVNLRAFDCSIRYRTNRTFINKLESNLNGFENELSVLIAMHVPVYSKCDRYIPP